MVNRKNVKETDGQNGHTVTQIHNRETRTDAVFFGNRCDLFDANDYRSQPENHQHNYSKTSTHEHVQSKQIMIVKKGVIL